MKPYFGLGVNSALEDVLALRAALDEHPADTRAALAAYSRSRAGEAAGWSAWGCRVERIGLQGGSRMVAGEAEALVRISRGLDRPGLLGFVTFTFYPDSNPYP